ncbi:MAG: cyclic nucleotide-binding domain-containing protein, partial [Myxococcota bacterium]
LIYLVLVVMFMDFRVGLIALLPNALPIAIYFGALGFTGVTLNPSTSLVGSLALGIAVDDTIHFFTRFNAEAKRRADERSGARAALRALIRPVTFTTLGLVLGFGVLTLSELGAQVQLGLLAGFTIAVAWVVDVTLSPALCSGVRIVTLWDVLRLDLGEAPQEEIELFKGLSLRQTRIFALMSDIRRLEAGERLVTEGEEGDDMFVIVHGELRAWVEKDGREVEFSIMKRGDVVGEVAYFASRRSANVDARSDALLVRFGHEDLERLQRRYPRTAAVVLANLNRVQAERLVRMTGEIERLMAQQATAG